MNKFIIVLVFMSLTISFGYAANSNIEKAKEISILIEKADYNYLGKKLNLQVLSKSEKENIVKIEIGVGTIDRPIRIHDCITFLFSNEGYVQKIDKEMDSGSCTF